MIDLHPSGIFNDVEIVDHGFKNSKSDNPKLCFYVKFKTEHGTVWGDFYLTDKAAEYTLEKIAAMGYTGGDLPELHDGTVLRGNIVQITVEHDTWNDKTTAKVAFVNVNNHVGGPTRDENAAASAKAFNAMMRKAQKAQVENDDDVPF